MPFKGTTTHKTQTWAFALTLVCTFFVSAGQILFKFASARITPDIFSILTNVPLFLGLASYGIGLLLLLLAFRGGELSVLYPIIASGYIWVCLTAPFFFKDDYMTIQKWIGLAFITAGIISIGIGSRRKYLIEK
jgi:undecaprenyl phosphate-alpha-L-ara4N flippase subunit ArnE